jgi:hypothetical protein
MHAALTADEMDGHNVLVLEVGGRLRLVLEALESPGVHRCGERQHLQGHPPAQGELLGLIDDPHAAPADLADDVEIPQRHACRDLCGSRGRAGRRIEQGQMHLRGCPVDEL